MGLFDSSTQVKPKMFGPSKDLMSTILKDAKKYYKSGNAGNVFSKPTVVGYGDDIKSGLTGLGALAGANSGGAGLSGQAQGIIDNGGFSDGQMRTLGAMEELANNGRLREMSNSADGLTADQRLVQDRSRGIMSSDFDINANPAYALVRDRALKEAQMGMDAQAAKSGRYGGASSQTIAARERGNVAADLDLNEYRNWQQRGDAAAQGLAALAGVGVGQRHSAIGLTSDLQSKLFNAQNSGLDRMGQAYGLAQQPARTQMEVGAMLDAQRQNVRNDEIRKFDAANPLNIYSQFMGLANGAPQGQTTTTQPSWAQMLAGGGLGLAALGSGLGWFGGGSAAAGAAGAV